MLYWAMFLPSRVISGSPQIFMFRADAVMSPQGKPPRQITCFQFSGIIRSRDFRGRYEDCARRLYFDRIPLGAYDFRFSFGISNRGGYKFVISLVRIPQRQRRWRHIHISRSRNIATYPDRLCIPVAAYEAGPHSRLRRPHRFPSVAFSGIVSPRSLSSH